MAARGIIYSKVLAKNGERVAIDIIGGGSITSTVLVSILHEASEEPVLMPQNLSARQLALLGQAMLEASLALEPAPAAVKPKRRAKI